LYSNPSLTNFSGTADTYFNYFGPPPVTGTGVNAYTVFINASTATTGITNNVSLCATGGEVWFPGPIGNSRLVSGLYTGVAANPLTITIISGATNIFVGYRGSSQYDYTLVVPSITIANNTTGRVTVQLPFTVNQMFGSGVISLTGAGFNTVSQASVYTVTPTGNVNIWIANRGVAVARLPVVVNGIFT
jgi:hypothetical protein